MALPSLADVTALVAHPNVQTYIANRPSLIAELTLGGSKNERLNADQNNKSLETPFAVVTPSVP